MKCKLLFFLGFYCFIAFSVVFAAVPAEVTYRGVLREYGQLITGKRKLCFNLYSTETGGQVLWTSGDINDVDVANGMFSCDLRPNVDLRAKDLWLEVYVSDKKLSGREKLTSNFFAMHSGSSENITSTSTVTITVGNSAIATISESEGIKSMINNTTYYMVPRGIIVMWSGDSASIPSGWALCDGANATPDLRGRFVVGYYSSDSDYNATGKIGGEKTHVITVGEMPVHYHSGATDNQSQGHTHSGSTSNNGSHAHSYATRLGYYGADGPNNGYWGNETSASTSLDGNHLHTFTTGDVSQNHAHAFSTDNTGNGQAHENRPPYYVLAFIMKL